MKFSSNVDKCKEMRVEFSIQSQWTPVMINGKELEFASRKQKYQVSLLVMT